MHHDPSGWAESAAGWITNIDKGDMTREVMLDASMLEMCGNVDGLVVLDAGCGEGRFCRMMADHGAYAIGLDPTLPLIEEARARDPQSDYVRGTAERLPFGDRSFDVVVSYLTLIDIPDYRAAISEFARVLKLGGRLVVGNISSHASTHPSGWVKDAQGHRLYYPVDFYLEERYEEISWGAIKIRNYHRPLSAYMEAYLGNGLHLKRFLEPAPSKEQVAEHPEWENDRRIAYVNAMLWMKPT